MRTITVQLPDDVHQGIQVLAMERHMSISQLYEDISETILQSHAAEVRFFARVAKGSREKGLALLNTLDQYYGDRQES